MRRRQKPKKAPPAQTQLQPPPPRQNPEGNSADEAPAAVEAEEAVPAVEEPPAEDSPALKHLRVRLASVRRAHKRATLGTAGCAILAVVLAWLVVECSLDYLAMLRLWLRAVFLVLALAACGVIAWWMAVRPMRRVLHEDAIALMIERALPIFRTRFIATIQLLRSERAAQPLVRALVAETSVLASAQNFRAVVDRRPLRLHGRVLAGLAVLAIGLAVLGGERTPPLLRRALLSREPVPRKTKIELLSTPRVLAVGDDFAIEARAGGEVPRRGRILIQPAKGPRHELPFDSSPADRARFARTLRSVQEPFAFTVMLGDARTEPVKMKVKPRPSIVSVDARQIFPAYTGLPEERRSLTGLKLLAGSRLAARVKSNTRLQSASLRLLGAPKPDGPAAIVAESALKLEGWGRTECSGEIAIPAAGAHGLAIHLVDDDGVESRSSTVYRLEVVPDNPPEVKLLVPARREEFLTAGATMLIAFDARDDFGIASARLHYAVDWQEGMPHKTIELDLPPGRPRELLRRFRWQIPRIQPPPTEGQVIDYWLEITDTNNVTGPGITTLERHQAAIVSEIEKRAELASRLSDAMQGLHNTRDAQERLSETLGEFIFEKPPETP